MKKDGLEEFPGGLVVRILCFHPCGSGLIPGLGTEIPHQDAEHCRRKEGKERKEGRKEGRKRKKGRKEERKERKKKGVGERKENKHGQKEP